MILSLRGLADLFGNFKKQGGYGVRLFSAIYTILDALDFFSTRLCLKSESGDSERVYPLKRGHNPYSYLRHKCFRHLSIKEIEILRWNFQQHHKNAMRVSSNSTAEQFVSESGNLKGTLVDLNTGSVDPTTSRDERVSSDTQTSREEKSRNSSMPDRQFERDGVDQLSVVHDDRKIIMKLQADISSLTNSLTQLREEFRWSRAYSIVSEKVKNELKYDRTLRNVFAVYFNIEGKYAYGAKQRHALDQTPWNAKFLRVKSHIPDEHIGRKVTVTKGSFIDSGCYADTTGLTQLK
jgi:hypothetical protein